MSEEVAFLTASSTAQLIRSKRVSASEVVRAYLARIERFDASLRTSITVLADEALKDAQTFDAKLAAGDASGPLGGVPIGVKDQFWTAGVRTTVGSRVYADQVPAEDATAVRRLKKAGAILLAKHNMPEFAIGTTREPPWGSPRNPWDITRSPGESSSGSAAALAADLCAAALGEDTGGSARGPASYCGVVGIRPTYGRVSRFGMAPMCWFMDTAAPMTKSVEDAALMLSAIAGHDPKDPYTSRQPVPDYLARIEDGIKGTRVGIVQELYESDLVDSQVRSIFDSAVRELERLGASVSRVSVPLIPLAGAMFIAIADVHGAAVQHHVLRDSSHLLDSNTRVRLQSAALVPVQAYHQAMSARILLRDQLDAVLRDAELLVSPTLPYTAPVLAGLMAPFAPDFASQRSSFIRRSFVCAYALAGMPAMSVPAGFTRDRMPVGMQLAASPLQEAALFRAGHAYLKATSWHDQRPRLSDSM